MSLDAEHEYHLEQAKIAAEAYASGMNPASEAREWRVARSRSQRLVRKALQATTNLADIPAGLMVSGEHVASLRHMLAPPLSQDQFKIFCPSYNKHRENKRLPLNEEQAAEIAKVFDSRRDRRLTRWLSANRAPHRFELTRLVLSASTLAAAQAFATKRRGTSSVSQETLVVEMLRSMTWREVPRRDVQQGFVLGAETFSHKAKLPTATRAQEADIACGLGGSVVVALECKVSNDETNSLKRVNDVLKKAGAWKGNWDNSFVRPAALLQGVFKYIHVKQLLDEKVQVFWSHDLDRLRNYLIAKSDKSAAGG